MAETRGRVNRDGGVRRLAWQRTEAGYRAWVVARPDVAAEGATWTETADALTRAVDESLHAGEWTAEWDPPRPAAEGALYDVSPDFVVLVPDGRFEVQGEAGEYYTGGVCPLCHAHRGERTAAPLRVRIETLAGIMFTSYRDTIANANYLFRRTTLDELGPERLVGAEVRRVERVDRGRAEVLEVIPPAAAAEEIVVRGMTIDGRQCPGCQMRYFSNSPRLGVYDNVYPRDRIPADAAAFWVKKSGNSSLCVRSAWWRERRGAPGFRGVIADGLHVAEADCIDLGFALPVR